jgi:hypothetical protein
MGAFAKGSKAFGFCDRCGFRYNLKELKSETVNLISTNLLVCPECWDPDQPQNMLGRIPVDDPQALRNPRPLGGISGRDLPAAYREDFSTGTIQTSPSRVDGWWVTNGTVSWNASRKSLNLANSGTSGDPYLWRGYNGLANVPDYLNINTSLYKYVVVEFIVNTFPVSPPDPRYPPYDFQGVLFFKKGTETTPPIDIWTQPGGSEKATALSQPYFPLSQISDGFSAANKDMASRYKIVFDLSDNSDWSGTVTTIRLDLFHTSPGYETGDIDINYVEVVAFHNPDL